MLRNKNEIIETVRKNRKSLWSVGIFTVFINLLMLVPSVYMLQVYDRVLPSHNMITLLMLTIIMLSMYGVMALLEYARSIIVIRIGNKIDACLNTRIYTAVFEENLKNGSLDAIQMLNDLTYIRQFFTGSALFAFFDVPWFPIYLLVLFFVNPWLGCFALIGAIVLIVLAITNELLSRKALYDANQFAIMSGNLASTNLRNAQVIEALGMLYNLKMHWSNLHQKFLYNQGVASERVSLISSITKFVRLSLQSLILGIGAWLAVDGYITPGMMIAGSILMGRSLSPIEQIINVWKNWNSAKLAYLRLVSLLERNPLRSRTMRLPEPKGNLSVEHVSAAPPGLGNSMVLHDITFSAAPGDVLGIIGPSASGKSTLARLLVGIWPATKGVVRVDHSDIYQWDKCELGPHIGYLPQDIELFPGTIAENIARFNEPDPEKVVQAAKIAGVHELILNLPNGYDSPIGSNGNGLSGGQKQRIGLARALYGDPSLIVLDEPNSNLDEAGEKALSEAIKFLKDNNKTVILITHRTNLLSITNKILLIINGSVRAFGLTHNVLHKVSNTKTDTSK
ncbi:type I secretion system permease/ATPase [Escherichia albertii]